MKSAFGIQLIREPSGGLYGQGPNGCVGFWKEGDTWSGYLQVASMSIAETIGSASPEACYRSLRGKVRNLAIGLAKLGIKEAKP